jgi:hypothetical protein
VISECTTSDVGSEEDVRVPMRKANGAFIQLYLMEK